jgi:hypothetical protein
MARVKGMSHPGSDVKFSNNMIKDKHMSSSSHSKLLLQQSIRLMHLARASNTSRNTPSHTRIQT